MEEAVFGASWGVKSNGNPQRVLFVPHLRRRCQPVLPSPPGTLTGTCSDPVLTLTVQRVCAHINMYTPSAASVHYWSGDLGSKVGSCVHDDLQLVGLTLGRFPWKTFVSSVAPDQATPG